MNTILSYLLCPAGLACFVGLAYLFSEDRKAVDWKLVGWAIGLQFLFSFLILKTAVGRWIFSGAEAVTSGMLNFAEVGASMLFGKLSSDASIGAIMAFRMLPVIIFTSSLMAILYHLRIIPFIVRCLARIMRRTLRTSGAETLAAALFIFMGIEAVTAIKTYIDKMTRSEIFTLMVGFMSTVAGSVMVIYTGFGARAGHLLAASVMSAPAAILLSKILVPEREEPLTRTSGEIDIVPAHRSILEAGAEGAGDGMKLALGVAAMLIAFVSLIALVNWPLAYLHTSFEEIVGYAAMPFTALTGVVPLREAFYVGQLVGIKTVLNEFLAYVKMQGMIDEGLLSERSSMIATYLLCGFANFGSLGILIAGMSNLAPLRKKMVVGLGLKSILAGTLAKFMTASIARILY